MANNFMFINLFFKKYSVIKRYKNTKNQLMILDCLLDIVRVIKRQRFFLRQKYLVGLDVKKEPKFKMSSSSDQNVKILSIDNKMYFITENVNTSEVETSDPEQEESETIWNQNSHALRDLLVFLVQKFCIEDVMDSKVKAQLWSSLHEEFLMYTNNYILVSKQQLSRKWHNWKQYNKNRKKPHPFAIYGVYLLLCRLE